MTRPADLPTLQSPPENTPARRKWVKAIKPGDAVIVCSEKEPAGVRCLAAVYGEPRCRTVRGRKLRPDGMLLPEKPKRFYSVDITLRWVIPLNAEEQERRERGVMTRRIANGLDGLSTDTMRAIQALAFPAEVSK